MHDVVTRVHDNLDALRAGDIQNPYTPQQQRRHFRYWNSVIQHGALSMYADSMLDDDIVVEHITDMVHTDNKISYYRSSYTSMLGSMTSTILPDSYEELDQILISQYNTFGKRDDVPSPATTPDVLPQPITKLLSDYAGTLQNMLELDETRSTICHYIHSSNNNDLVNKAAEIDYHCGYKSFHGYGTAL